MLKLNFHFKEWATELKSWTSKGRIQQSKKKQKLFYSDADVLGWRSDGQESQWLTCAHFQSRIPMVTSSASLEIQIDEGRRDRRMDLQTQWKVQMRRTQKARGSERKERENQRKGQTQESGRGRGSEKGAVGKNSMKGKMSLLDKHKNIGTKRETKGKTDLQ